MNFADIRKLVKLVESSEISEIEIEEGEEKIRIVKNRSSDSIPQMVPPIYPAPGIKMQEIPVQQMQDSPSSTSLANDKVSNLVEVTTPFTVQHRLKHLPTLTLVTVSSPVRRSV